MRWFASWSLYWLGDAVSRVLRDADFAAPVLYPIYSRLMRWSSAAQGTGDSGPWVAVDT